MSAAAAVALTAVYLLRTKAGIGDAVPDAAVATGPRDRIGSSPSFN